MCVSMYVRVCVCVSWFGVSISSCSGGWSHSVVWLNYECYKY